jgi:hypothetical protein
MNDQNLPARRTVARSVFQGAAVGDPALAEEAVARARAHLHAAEKSALPALLLGALLTARLLMALLSHQMTLSAIASAVTLGALLVVLPLERLVLRPRLLRAERQNRELLERSGRQ